MALSDSSDREPKASICEDAYPILRVPVQGLFSKNTRRWKVWIMKKRGTEPAWPFFVSVDTGAKGRGPRASRKPLPAEYP